MQVVQAQGINKSYKGRTVLSGMSFTVEQGEALAILGPSGCGKSTLLRILAGLTAPDAGTVTIDGELATEGRKIRLSPMKRRVSMVFQDLALWPHLTAEKHLKIGLAQRSLTRTEKSEQIDSYFKRFDIEEHRKKYPDAMSGGERQRLALARALCVDPRVLLLDEPLGHLDADLKETTIELLKTLVVETGVTMIYVTHDPREAETLGARVIQLEKLD